MRLIIAAIWNYVSGLPQRSIDSWMTFWFRPTDPATLALVRIGTGLVMLVIYATLTPDTLRLVGPHGYVDDTAVAQLSASSADLGGRFVFSVWDYVRNPQVITVFHYYFLAAILCFTVGFFSRTSNLVIWLMHLSYVQRGHIFWYGVDAMLSILLICLLLGPTGRAFAVDGWLRKRWQKNETPSPAIQHFWTANFSIRTIQLHWCMVYLCSGLSKLQGESWWDGTAVMQILMLNELSDVDFRWLGALNDRTLSTLSALSVFVTLAFEIGFSFLIWNARLRPLLLFCAVLLHGGIAFVMGLPAFGSLMIIGCFAFVSPESVGWFFQSLVGQTKTQDIATD